jgi:hypothetical protein
MCFVTECFYCAVGLVLYWACSQNCEKRLIALSCLSVCLSVCLSTLLPLDGFWRNFIFDYFLKIYRENSRLIIIWHTKITILHLNTIIYFWSYLANFFLEWEMFQTKVVQKIKTHFVFSNFFFLYRAVCGIMWRNLVEPYIPQITIWGTRIACWIPKATKTHSDHVILIAFALQQWL